MNQKIESTFVADGVTWEYEAWFERDSAGEVVAAVRHRRKPSTGEAATARWAPSAHITLPQRHGYTLGHLAYAHFSGVLGWPVEPIDFDTSG